MTELPYIRHTSTAPRIVLAEVPIVKIFYPYSRLLVLLAQTGSALRLISNWAGILLSNNQTITCFSVYVAMVYEAHSEE